MRHTSERVGNLCYIWRFYFRFNGYTSDPSSQCNPKYSIAARFDLACPNGSFSAFGATDMKVRCDSGLDAPLHPCSSFKRLAEKWRSCVTNTSSEIMPHRRMRPPGCHIAASIAGSPCGFRQGLFPGFWRTFKLLCFDGRAYRIFMIKIEGP